MLGDKADGSRRLVTDERADGDTWSRLDACNGFSGLLRLYSGMLDGRTVFRRKVVDLSAHVGVHRSQDRHSTPTQIRQFKGTTIAAVHALERGGLRAAVINAVVAATERSKELGALAQASKKRARDEQDADDGDGANGSGRKDDDLSHRAASRAAREVELVLEGEHDD